MKVKSQNKAKGDYYENLAGVFLEKEMKYNIISKKFRGKIGEIDIIAKDEDYLVFIEVKYRKNTMFGYPEEAVDKRKQNKIRLTANEFLKKYSIKEDTNIRFDVVSVLKNQIKVIKNAF